MSEETAVESLQELGLTEYQSRAYVAAVRLGTARPNDLADESGVPQARIYDVIDDLHGRGLVEVHEGSRGKEVRAPPPDRALDALRKRHIDEFTETIEDASTALSQLHERKPASDAFVSMVSHRESALRHLERAIDDAEWWLTLSLSPTLYRRLRDRIEAALDRGATVRLLLQAADGGPGVSSLSFPERLRVRYRDLADTFVLADRRYGVYNGVRPGSGAEPYIIMQEPNLLLVFQSYCEQIWPASEVVQSGDGFPRRYLDPWHAIVDLREQLDADDPLRATVSGRDTSTGRTGTWTGRIVDYELAGPPDTDYRFAVPVAASLALDADDGRVTVGGWKARVEDVAAEGVEVERE